MHDARLHLLHLPSQHLLPLLYTQLSYSHTDLLIPSHRALASLQAFSFRYLASAIPELDMMERLETTSQRGESAEVTRER